MGLAACEDEGTTAETIRAFKMQQLLEREISSFLHAGWPWVRIDDFLLNMRIGPCYPHTTLARWGGSLIFGFLHPLYPTWTSWLPAEAWPLSPGVRLQ